MFRRHFLFVGILFAAAVVPFAASSTDKIKQWFGGSGAKAEPNPLLNSRDPFAAGNRVALPPQPARTPPSGMPALDPRLEGGPVADLAEVFRFDIPPAWVRQRWPRVSTVVAPDNPQWTGLRVPLVSGTRPDDLAGSLTYFFTPKNYVRRITFQGQTQDPRRLIALLAAKYEFAAESSDVPGELRYQVRWNGKPVSELVCRPSQATPGMPHTYSLTLEINNFAAK